MSSFALCSTKVAGVLAGAALMFAAAGVASASHNSGGTSIGVSNSASITNVSTAVANTGGNSVKKFGAIFTGDALAFTKTLNIVNTTFIDLW